MEDPTSHLSTDTGKAIWYLRNSIQLFCLKHDYMESAANVAIDKCILENTERKKRGEQTILSVREVEELQMYDDEVCDNLRWALPFAYHLAVDVPSCKRLLQSIDSRHVAGTPGFRSFIFEALVELETLEVAVENSDPNKSGDESELEILTPQTLNQRSLELEVLKILARDPSVVWTKDTMASEIRSTTSKKTSASSVGNTNAMKVHRQDKGKDRQPRKPDLNSEDALDHLLRDADPKLLREVKRQKRSIQSDKGERVRGNKIASVD